MTECLSPSWFADTSSHTNVREAMAQSAELCNILDFPDPSLLRGTSVGTLTSFAGAIFSSAEGSEATFSKSRPVKSVHTFVSHNWAVGRWRKFLLVAVHFNLQWGVFASAFAVTAFVAHQAFEEGGCWGLLLQGPRPEWQGVMHLVVTPAMLLVILLARNFAAAVRLHGPAVFLDKCCISQTDKELQRRGIEKLGAFLLNSRYLLVCFSELYLLKLWTVYELCAFLVLKDHSHIFVAPVDMAAASIVTCVAFWLVTFVHILCRQRLPLDILLPYYVLVVPVVWLVCFLPLRWLRRYFLRLSALQDAALAFDVRTALCAKEEDRHHVEEGIVLLMRHVRRDRPGEVSRESLLLEFNELVRSWAPWAVQRSAGRFGIPLGHLAAMISVPIVTLSLELSHLHPEPIPLMLLRSVTSTCLVPAIGALLCTRWPQLEGVREAAYVAVLAFALPALFVLMDGELEIVYAYHMLCKGPACKAIVVHWIRWLRALLLLGLLVMLYRPKQQRRPSPLSFKVDPEVDTFTL